MSAIFDFFWQRLPLSLARLMSPRSFVSLMYHVVSEAPLPHVQPLYPCKTPSAFDLDLAFIKDHGRAIDHETLRRAREKGEKLPHGAIAITFDDGFKECFGVVRPLLLDHEIPATFFVIPSVIDNEALMIRNEVALCLDAIEKLDDAALRGMQKAFATRLELHADSRAGLAQGVRRLTYLDGDRIHGSAELLGIDTTGYLQENRPYLTREEILQLHEEGFTIGAHTIDHPELWLLKDFDSVARQITESCAWVRDLTGQKRVPFAFPFNGRAIDRNRLAELRHGNPFVCLMYDTNNFMRDREFIVNRINADIPGGASPGESNISILIKKAHTLEPLRQVKRWLMR